MKRIHWSGDWEHVCFHKSSKTKSVSSKNETNNKNGWMRIQLSGEWEHVCFRKSSKTKSVSFNDKTNGKNGKTRLAFCLTSENTFQAKQRQTSGMVRGICTRLLLVSSLVATVCDNKNIPKGWSVLPTFLSLHPSVLQSSVRQSVRPSVRADFLF